MNRLERYLQSENTVLAKGLKKISPSTGAEYRNSKTKRLLDVAVAAPAVVFAAPAAIAGLAVTAIDRRGNPVCFANRRDENWEDFSLLKIYSMHDSAVEERDKYLPAIQKFGDAVDPRITRVGRGLRQLNVDESLQLLQVLSGKLSLVGSRVIADYAVDEIKRSHPEGFEGWKRSYMEAKPSLMSLNSAYSINKKNERRRYNYDLIYAEKASLGLDMLILFKHVESGFHSLGKMAESVLSRISSLTPRV